MNGIHDLGGKHGLGPIDVEPNEPVFHADWERRMFGMFILGFAGGHFNIDQFRYGMEQMSPPKYLESDYYEHWMHSLEIWLEANGTLKAQEIEERMNELREKEAA
ncbi:Nitrile hydratase subunit beta [compost metagenome]